MEKWSSCPASLQPHSDHARTGLNGILHFSVLALDAGFDEGCVGEDEHRGRADEPEEGHDRGRPPEEGQADHEERGVERLLGHDVFADLHRLGG